MRLDFLFVTRCSLYFACCFLFIPFCSLLFSRLFLLTAARYFLLVLFLSLLLLVTFYSQLFGNSSFLLIITLRARLHDARSEFRMVWNLKPLWKDIPLAVLMWSILRSQTTFKNCSVSWFQKMLRYWLFFQQQ